MEGKDNRSKDKRTKMKQYRRGHNNNTSSSSGQKEIIRGSGVIDVVDSSDERYSMRRGADGWVTSSKVACQPRRYSLELEDEEENAQMQAGDFNLMSQLPTSIGGNFQFSSEKNWDTNEELLNNTEASEYFTLNLKLLNVGLQTVPFYKRMDYASSMFTANQLLAMEKSAEVAEKNYQNVLKEHDENPRIKINNASRKGSAKSQQSAKAASAQDVVVTAATAEAPDELDELLNMTTTQVANIKVGNNVPAASTAAAVTDAAPAAITGSASDIQQWLDNVLDE